jgi:glutamate-5-semialdehyde dehydrogenase
MHQDLQSGLHAAGRAARQASRALAKAPSGAKNGLLRQIALDLEAGRARIREANLKDLEAGRAAGLSGALLDRLDLTEARYASMVKGVREVAALPDPVGEVLKAWTLPNGLAMEKVRIPIGVIGIIYESRPNVTVDSGVLCLKTGNACILRGGKEAIHTNLALAEAMREAAVRSGFPADVLSMVTVTSREAIPILCRMDDCIDLMIPRGGHGLIEAVVSHARMPVIKHFHGVCHVYVHAGADLAMAEKILVNGKCQRPGVCNSVETLLVDRSVAHEALPRLAGSMRGHGVKVLADAATSEILREPFEEPANWTTEYLDLILAVRVVSGLEEAIGHINTHGSHHSDTIVTGDREAGERFLLEVDSAAVYWNASTRFTDGGQFGFGAEIGISTDKIHARGPMGLEELTSYKFVARGDGQIRD